MADDADPAVESLEAELARLRLELAASRAETADARAELARRDDALAESREQQAATAEILRVISRVSTDVQLVLDAIVECAVRLTHADGALVQRLEGDYLRNVAGFAIDSPVGIQDHVRALL